MSFWKVLIISILIIILGFGVILVYNKNRAQKVANEIVLGTNTDDWIDYSNEKYGYEVWCPKDFVCQYVCGAGNAEGEQFCANPIDNNTVSLYMSQIPIKDSSWKPLSINIFSDKYINVPPNDVKILDKIYWKIKALSATALDDSKYQITGVARIDGYSAENEINGKTNHTEEWFFVKNDLLYHTTIKYIFDTTNKESTQKLVDVLNKIFGTVSF